MHSSRYGTKSYDRRDSTPVMLHMPKQGMHGFAHHDELVQSILHPAYVGLRHDADATQNCSSNCNHTKLVNATHVLYWLKFHP